MFAALGRAAYRWRYPILVIWLLATLAALPVIPRVADSLQVGGFASTGTEEARAAQLLQRELGFSPSTMLVIYESDAYSASDPAFKRAVANSLEPVRQLPFVTDVVLPNAGAGMIAANNRTAYAMVGLKLPAEEAQRVVPAFEAAIAPQENITISVAGGPAFYRDIESVSQHDLQRAELIAFPIALITLLLVFGSVTAALLPMVVGATGVAMVLMTLVLVTQFTDLSIFVLNLATMLGLGLAVDYSLFVTSRFREELQRQQGDVPLAVERTVATAGKAVFFSGATVLIGLLGLSLFEFMFLRSVGIAGVIVVAWSTVAALTLLPAVLSIVGTSIDRFAIRRTRPSSATSSGFWVRLSEAVMARPVLVLIPTLVLLLLLGSPFRHAVISSPDATILPTSLPSRQAFDLLVRDYGPGVISPFVIVVEAPGKIFTPESLRALHDLAAMLEEDPRIVRVQSPVSGTLSLVSAMAMTNAQRGLQQLGVDTGIRRVASDNVAVIFAYSRYLPGAAENKALLTELRDISIPGMEILVEGGTAAIVDSVSEMYAAFPKAIALIVLATYLILMAFFRSVLLPIKAIFMNGLSILASYGALVWVFQDGHLSQWLGFTPLGYVEASLPIIMFCILFGLSMDYEVFLLSRIREEWERTGDNTRAVAIGMQRSGRIITSAALLVVVVTASFVTADVVLIKALGFGIALAVLLDATVVRALLVPSTMKLLGALNWWLPAPLQRLLPLSPLSEE